MTSTRLKTTLLVPALLAGALLTGCGDSDSPSGSQPASALIGKLYVNELGPSNATVAADEAGQYDDWIELYNSSGSEINLGGLSISNDSNIPLMKVFASTLKVPANGFLMLWADKDVTQGDNHLPFKLSAAGSQVLLYGGDQKLIDQHKWANAVQDQSFARIPDATGPFVLCGSPTPGESNGSGCTANPDAGGQ